MELKIETQQVYLDRLIKLRDFIIAEPQQLYMGQFSVEEYRQWLEEEILNRYIDQLYNQHLIDELKQLNNNLKENNICNTARCVAGWACIMFIPDFNPNNPTPEEYYDYYFNNAQEILGLNREDAGDLFRMFNNKEFVIEFLNKIIKEKSNLVNVGT